MSSLSGTGSDCDSGEPLIPMDIAMSDATSQSLFVRRRPLLICAACAVLVFIVAMRGDLLQPSENTYSRLAGCSTVEPTGQNDGHVKHGGISGGSDATSGGVFTPKRYRVWRTRARPVVLKEEGQTLLKLMLKLTTPEQREYCKFWGVTTTIFPPTEASRVLLTRSRWCLVVVADKKGPRTYNIETGPEAVMVYLTVSRQQAFAAVSGFIDLLPWNHFGRKNVGYLFAVAQGAHAVWDFDDDNILKGDPSWASLSADHGHLNVQKVCDGCWSSQTFNPYPWFRPKCTAERIWPRGFPLDRINDDSTSHIGCVRHEDVSVDNVAVIQSLADDAPDLDALFRLTHPSSIEFRGARFQYNATSLGMISVPSAAFAPYNAQATMHFPAAYWAMLLPISVHGRVSDIWRSYFAGPLFRALGLRVIFSDPLVVQKRNPHNYMGDMSAEDDLYRKAGGLVQFLQEWSSGDKADLADAVHGLWVDMYEHGFIEASDVQAVTAWLGTLSGMGYVFPKLQKSSLLSSLRSMLSPSPTSTLVDPIEFRTEKRASHASRPLVRIVVMENMRSDFIEWQYLGLKKFLVEDFEYILVDGSKDKAVRKELKRVADKYQFTLVRETIWGSQDRKDWVNFGMPWAMNWAFDTFLRGYKGLFVFANSDMMLWKRFSVAEYLTKWNVTIAGLTEGHVVGLPNYINPGLVLINASALPAEPLNWGRTVPPPPSKQTSDVGGNTAYWLQRHPNVSFHVFRDCVFRDYRTEILLHDLIPMEIKRAAEVTEELAKVQVALPINFYTEDGSWLHRRGGSNWKGFSQANVDNVTSVWEPVLRKILDDDLHYDFCDWPQRPWWCEPHARIPKSWTHTVSAGEERLEGEPLPAVA